MSKENVMSFITFKQAVAKQFSIVSKYPLFRTDVSGDEMWATYLTSFPEGVDRVDVIATHYEQLVCSY
jgi:hypothetical protein